MQKANYFLTVTAKPKNGGSPILFEQVYDIGHYYSRNTGNDHQTIRLLIGDPDGIGETKRAFIDLLKYDIEIVLERSI